MYSTVQKSLTSPLHAWHLYHALQYFDAHEPKLREVARQPVLQPVIAVMDRLDHRLRISKTKYVKARAKVRARRAAHRVGRDLFGRALYGLQKLGASMMADVTMRPGHTPGLPEPQRTELLDHLLPGDVLVVRKEYAVTNYFLPGYWPHAALYLGDTAALTSMGIAQYKNVRQRWQLFDRSKSSPLQGNSETQRYVLEAMKDGVRIRPLDSPLASDSVVVLRPKVDRNDVAQAIARGLGHEGKPYDFDFDFDRSDRLVCTEVVYRAYEGIADMQFRLTRRAGRNTLSAGDLVRMALERTHLEPIALFSPEHSVDVLTGDAAQVVLQQSPCGD